MEGRAKSKSIIASVRVTIDNNPRRRGVITVLSRSPRHREYVANPLFHAVVLAAVSVVKRD